MINGVRYVDGSPGASSDASSISSDPINLKEVGVTKQQQPPPPSGFVFAAFEVEEAIESILDVAVGSEAGTL
eukprot:CAMPEP_0174996634 /NCGR_PEP_ID=MMETSP0005-20121125/508_1 /TAXON_ID=420556 /ORGANISM="Ochromonas sp., Strain CCMP1393" /LENGTH=71 /DNA_ID=CAMNT_0016251073 /DNA_START=199 /DNA_END=415 /DNA_ORIENTATION=+